MKKINIIFLVSLTLFLSCSSKEKQINSMNVPEMKQEKIHISDTVTKGKNLFISNGCTACHDEHNKTIGPSVQKIANTYVEKNGDVLKFLKQETEPIVDTNKSMVAIMKNNIETNIINITDEDLTSIVKYINSLAHK